MTSRQRILATLKHEIPDLIPIDFGGMRSTGIHAQAYARLARYLGFPDLQPRVFDVMQMLAYPDRQLRERFASDVVQLPRWLALEAKRLAELDCAVLGPFGGSFLEAGFEYFGMERFFINLLSAPKLVEHFFSKLLQAHIEDFDRYREAVGKRVDIINVSDDLGSQNGPLISPETYRQVIKPFHRRLYAHIREKSGMFLFLHSCGSIYAFIPDLIEAGVQILNPIQYRAGDMEPRRLKKEFGKDIVFWGGGCDTQQVLSRGSLEEIKAETEMMIRIFAPGGGFVFTQVHNIQPGVAPEKILALYEVIKKCRKAYS